MTTITIDTGTHDDVVAATGQVGRCKVMAVRNAGDGAGEVYVQAGDHYRNAGQMADYRHNVTLDDARRHGAGAIVETYYSDGTWHNAVTPVDRQISADAVRQVVRERVEARDRAASAQRRAEAAASYLAEQAERASEAAAIIAAVSSEAERRWPGRCKVRRTEQGLASRYIVERWDAPKIPGHGLPDHTHAVMFRGYEFVIVGV